jgi:hypothetical protein
MDDKQSKLLMWMAVIFGLLVAVLVFVEAPDAPDDAEEGAPNMTRVFPDLAATAVQSVEIQRGNESLVQLTRAEGRWVLGDPAAPDAAEPADTTVVEGLLGSAVRLEAGDALEIDPESPGFGLADATSIRMMLADGTTHTLSVGADTPVGDGTYILDAAGVSRVSRLSVAETFSVSQDDLRSKEVVRFPASAVDRVAVVGTARTLSLTRDAHGWWVQEQGHPVDGVVAPVPEGRHRADEDRVSSLLAALQQLRVVAFPEAPPALADGGVTIEVGADGQTWTVALAAGADGIPYVMGPMLTGPAPSDTRSVDTLLAAPGVAWRSPLFLPIRAITLTHIDAGFGDKTITADREGEVWSDPRGAALLNALSDVRVDRAIEPPPVSGAPWGHITLAEGGTQEESVSLYQSTVSGWVALDAAGSAPFFVPHDAVTSLLDALDGTKAAPEAPKASPASELPPGLEGLLSPP